MRRAATLTTAALVVLVAAACYPAFDFNADKRADRIYLDPFDNWLSADEPRWVLDAEPGDLPVPHDWDGDHLWDAAVVRPNGDWVTGSTVGTTHFPAPPQIPGFTNPDFYGIVPVPADYDGDGRADPAWYRDSDGTWFIEGMDPIDFGSGPTLPPGSSPNRLTIDQDIAVPADYDGDGADDLATFDPRTLEWSVRSSATGTDSTVVMPHNEGAAFPAPADYDGVGHAQRATFGWEGWDIEGRSLDPFGTGRFAVPAVADHDGDNRADRSYVEGDGTWHTEGSDDTTSIGGDLDTDRYPLATGYNLIRNVARVTIVGRCVFDPAECD
jgi:hypothetical protein